MSALASCWRCRVRVPEAQVQWNREQGHCRQCGHQLCELSCIDCKTVVHADEAKWVELSGHCPRCNRQLWQAPSFTMAAAFSSPVVRPAPSSAGDIVALWGCGGLVVLAVVLALLGGLVWFVKFIWAHAPV